MDERNAPDTIRERAHGNTTDARHWLRQHHGRLRKRLLVRYPPYAELAVEMAALGLVGGTKHDQKPLTARAVRRLWQGVRRDIEADAALRAPKRTAATAGWTPEPARQPRAAPASPVMTPPGPGSGDYLADMRAEINKRSGRR